MRRDHSADAGGDPEVLHAKQALRAEVWQALRDAGVARFPGAAGRIPNFTGAEAAADRLRATPAWRRARAVKANPDSPQRPVRERALEDGMVVFMAVPRLADERPFLRLDPADLTVGARAASSIKGASLHGVPVGVGDLPTVDLVLCGCVAVDRRGARLGKGGGFADLEFAVASAAGLIGPQTVVATTVHALQVVDSGRIPVTEHDVPVDLIVTPEELITCGRRRSRPAAILWDELTPEKVDAIPLLRTLAARR